MSRVIPIPEARTVPVAYLDGRTVLLPAAGADLTLPTMARDSVGHIYALGACTVSGDLRDPSDPDSAIDSIDLVAGDYLIAISDRGADWRLIRVPVSIDGLADRVATLEETVGTSAMGWWWGRWTLVSGQRTYLWADASASVGTASGAASTDRVSCEVTVEGIVQDADEFTVSTSGITLASIPPSGSVGMALTVRVQRAIT